VTFAFDFPTREEVDAFIAKAEAPTNILATRLKELQDAGILYRLPLAHNQRAYALTERGAALGEAIAALARWGGTG
jgi:DNA-binding HxlR family transcriptional regulator